MPWSVLVVVALFATATAQPDTTRPLPDRPVVVDRVVSVVGDRIITLSDVRLEEALRRWDPSPVEMLQRRRQEDTLALLVDAAVVRNLAGEIAIYTPSTPEVQRRVDGIRARFDTRDDFDAFLRQHGLTIESLAGRLYARMVTERYVARNIELAATSAGDSPDEAYARYLEWIEPERARVEIRMVPPQPGPR